LEQKTNKKIWIEYLRVLAIIAVIVIHVTTGTYNKFGHIDITHWLFASFLNSCSRFAVPVFVMISGCVLLGRDIGIRKFYTTRAIRLIPPILFWSLFYIAFEYLYHNQDIGTLMWKLKFGIIISGNAYYHLWYLPMFSCLMLVFPVINNYILGHKPTKEDFFLVLGLFLFFMLLNQISIYVSEVFHIGMDWFKTFPWFLGYFIMGYFIDHYHHVIRINNIATMGIIIFLLILVNVLNFYSASILGIVKDTFIINNTGFFDFILTLCIFYLFAKNRKIFKENYLISRIASASFGIYLIHPVFMEVSFDYLGAYVENSLIYLPLLVMVTFIASYFCILLVSKLKWLRHLF